MRGRLTVLATALLLTLAFATPASAINNGQLDDQDKYPYVGVVLVPATGGGYWMCSAAAISDTKVITAAHCIDDYASPGPEDALVTFDASPAFGNPSGWTTGTIYPHPKWCIGCGPGLPGFDTYDVAVVLLDSPVSLLQTAILPDEGYVDTLSRGTKVDIAGYGLRRERGKAKLARTDVRYYAPTKLIPSKHVHSDEFIKLSANTAKAKGGICFGDSGGPDLEAGTNRILAVNSYGTNGNCAGVSYSNRIDLADILSFIANPT